MMRRILAAVLLVLALAAAAPAQVKQFPGWRPPPAVDYALAARALQSGVDWRQREEAATQLGGSGDMRWIATLARAAAGDPSLRVRQAARDAIDSIRDANGSPGPAPLPPRPGPDPWDGGFLPDDPNAEMIDSWYRQYLGRSVDRGGLSSRLVLLRRGTDPEEIEADIIGSGEYWERHGSNVVGFVRGLYADVLGREPNRIEVRNWQDRYAVNRGNRSAVAREFLQAAAREQYRRRYP
jgi:HEAT repeat protein